MLDKPTLKPADIFALNDTKLINWYDKNEDSIYALVVVQYNDFYSYWQHVRQVLPAGGTLTDAVRNGLDFYFGAGISSQGVQPTNNNMYSRALLEHLNDMHVTKTFNWQMYWAGLLPNQGAIEKLLTTFYNYIIVKAIDRGIENDRSSPQSVQKYTVMVQKVNTTPGLFRKV